MNTYADAASRRSAGVNAGGGRFIKIMARTGYIAKGVVYSTVGILSASAVFGWFGVHAVRGTRGAVEAIAAQPFGNFLLVLLMAGLAGYVLWRFVQAIVDTEDKGTGFKGWVQRIGFMISGATYAALAYYAMRLGGWFATGPAQGGTDRRELTAEVMQNDAGVLLVGLIGIAFLGVGLYQGYRAVTDKFKENWKTNRLSESEERVATRLARFGIGVRAVTFLIIGSLITKAAVYTDPSEAKGLAEALRTIYEQPFGQALLVAAAIGLFCYGIYCLFNSRYRAMTLR